MSINVHGFVIAQVIDGLDWLITNHKSPAIAVLALGGDAQYALDQAAHNLVLAGVPVIVAAGNDGTDACTVSPARYKVSGKRLGK